MTLPSSGRRRVLVVDDSAFMRRLVSDVVQSSGEFQVVGTARDGEDALRQIETLDPDLVTLDVDMPALDGLSALRRIMRDHPRPVVMLSAGGRDGGAEATLQALEAGAVEFVRKPSGAISLDLDLVGDRLLEALRAAACAQIPLARQAPADASVHAPMVASADARSPASSTGPATAAAPNCLVTIAASTGGPAALAQIIPALPAWRDVAVLIVQHMPTGFTASFARRLHGAARLAVHEAEHDAPVRAGVVYVAPGGSHCTLTGSSGAPRLALDTTPPVWGVRPAADPLFASVARLYGSRVIGVVLTGMGRDGADGLKAVRAAGGFGLVQESASCIVDGMPDAARRIAGADAIVPLPELAAAISAAVQRCREHDVAA